MSYTTALPPNEVRSNDGIIKVYALCQRSSVNVAN